MLATEEPGKLCRCSAIFVGNYKRAVFRKAAHNGSAYAVCPAHDKRNSRGGVLGRREEFGSWRPGHWRVRLARLIERSPATVDDQHRPGDVTLARWRESAPLGQFRLDAPRDPLAPGCAPRRGLSCPRVQVPKPSACVRIPACGKSVHQGTAYPARSACDDDDTSGLFHEIKAP
ncbi:hypothetical protein [Rhizobium esperanzae]|uniref:hypothetical protein n=1 Tax=Rhizobium esperanzae TaxID=1967781 RepID=UPI001FD97FE0